MKKVLLLFFCIIISGCGNDQTDENSLENGDSHDIDMVDVAENDPVKSENDKPPFGSFNGRWAQYQELVATVTTMGMVVKNFTKSILLLDLKNNGETVDVSSEVCDIVIDDDTPVIDLVVPDAFIKAMPEAMYTYSVTKMEDHYLVHQDKLYDIRGVKLDDPENEPLPTSADDPRVFDQDNDGNPGLTVYITNLINSAMYIVQRDWTILDGKTIGKDRFDGSIEWYDEQVVLDAEVKELLSERVFAPLNEESCFKTIKIDDEWDCEVIMNNKKRLFPDEYE